MSTETKRELARRSVMIVECFAVIIAYVGIVAMLIYPALDAASLIG